MQRVILFFNLLIFCIGCKQTRTLETDVSQNIYLLAIDSVSLNPIQCKIDILSSKGLISFLDSSATGFILNKVILKDCIVTVTSHQYYGVAKKFDSDEINQDTITVKLKPVVYN